MKKLILVLLPLFPHVFYAQTAQEIENVTAFNRLYGYVKYFHPSDEAAAIDWNKFAIYGSAEVLKCKDAACLQKTLVGLFEPIAPTIAIVRQGHGRPFSQETTTPPDTAFIVRVEAQSQKTWTVAEDAAWCWFSDPRAVYHKGTAEKIYFGFINSNGDVVIGEKNLKTQAMTQFVLHEALQIDDHNVPSILMLPDGRILAFYTEHNGRFFMRKSRHPEDITFWEDEQTISFGLADKRICYSNPVMLSAERNRIYMFFRAQTPGMSYTGWGQYYAYSDDLGKSWTDARYYLDTKAIDNPAYVKIASDNRSRIDILFTDGHPKIGAASVYHVYYEKGKFHQTSGKPITSPEELPLQPAIVNKLYDADAEKTKSWIWDIALDKRGRPVVAYARYPSVNDHIYHYARWDGSQWQDYPLINSGSYITQPEPSGTVLEEHYSGGIVLDHHDPANLFLSRQVDGVFEIEQWRRKGDRWNKQTLTENSNKNNVRPYVIQHYTGKEPMVMWMRGEYEHYKRFRTELVVHQPEDKMRP